MPTVLGKTFSRRELARRVGDFSQLFGVELLSHSNGRKRALRVLRFRTGSGLSFDIRKEITLSPSNRRQSMVGRDQIGKIVVSFKFWIMTTSGIIGLA